MAKLKTHMLTTISCALKNIYGCLPYPCKIAFHRFLGDAIVDANIAMRPRFSIVDGSVAHIGTQGPAYGIPVRADAMVAGPDIVSVDATCSRLLGFKPLLVGHVRKAHSSGIGSMRSEILGPDLKELVLDPEYHSFEKLAFSIARRIRSMRSGDVRSELSMREAAFPSDLVRVGMHLTAGMSSCQITSGFRERVARKSADS
jgi:uncharacterized protein (DUF362 family)